MVLNGQSSFNQTDEFKLLLGAKKSLNPRKPKKPSPVGNKKIWQLTLEHDSGCVFKGMQRWPLIWINSGYEQDGEVHLLDSRFLTK